MKTTKRSGKFIEENEWTYTKTFFSRAISLSSKLYQPPHITINTLASAPYHIAFTICTWKILNVHIRHHILSPICIISLIICYIWFKFYDLAQRYTFTINTYLVNFIINFCNNKTWIDLSIDGNENKHSRLCIKMNIRIDWFIDFKITCR